jgi:hypothetical protein
MIDDAYHAWPRAENSQRKHGERASYPIRRPYSTASLPRLIRGSR